MSSGRVNYIYIPSVQEIKRLGMWVLVFWKKGQGREFNAGSEKIFPSSTAGLLSPQFAAAQNKTAELTTKESCFSVYLYTGLFTWRESAPANRATRLGGLTHSPLLHATHLTETVSEMCGLSAKPNKQNCRPKKRFGGKLIFFDRSFRLRSPFSV